MNMGDRSKKIRTLAVCAMLSAIGVVILYLGAIIDVLDISMAVISSLFVVFAVIEYGGAAPWAIFTVTGLLSLLLLPSKLPAIMYVCFFGFYPILKEKTEKLNNRVLRWVIKEVIFNICLILLMVIGTWLLYLDEENIWLFEVIFFFLANGTFIIYDIALTRLITFYVFKLRNKFKFK